MTPGSGPCLEDSDIPLYVQISAAIRDLIVSGSLLPRSRVPSEVDLARHYRVSRMTARKAVDQLVASGALFRRPSKGTFVAEPKIARPIFSSHHSFVAVMRELGLEHSTRVLQKRTFRPPPHVARALRIDATATVAYVRRLRLVEGRPYQLYVAYISPPYTDVLDADMTGSITELLAGRGAHLVSSSNVLEAAAATAQEARLLDVKTGAPLIRVEGTSFSADLSPVHLTIALFPGERCRLLVDARADEASVQLEPK